MLIICSSSVNGGKRENLGQNSCFNIEQMSKCYTTGALTQLGSNTSKDAIFHLNAAVCGEADFKVVAYEDSVDPKD